MGLISLKPSTTYYNIGRYRKMGRTWTEMGLISRQGVCYGDCALYIEEHRNDKRDLRD